MTPTNEARAKAIAELLVRDPLCSGRVTVETVNAIAALGTNEARPAETGEADAYLIADTRSVTLAACPIELFMCQGELCLKTEYGNNEGRVDAFIVSSGEFFWGSAPQTIKNQRVQRVVPVRIIGADLEERAATPTPDKPVDLGADAERGADEVGLAEAAGLAIMYLETGFIECGQCGNEVPTKDLDAVWQLRDGLATPTASVDATIERCANVVGPKHGGTYSWLANRIRALSATPTHPDQEES